MASPSSGDDYYASLGNEPTQTNGSTEKKKIIKIVAKKAVSSTAETVIKAENQSISSSDTTPIANFVEPFTPSQPIEKEPEVIPYVSRTVKLPESGTLDLGSKFSSGPSVVFHTHNALPKPLGSNRMQSNAPLSRGQGQ
jgi:hypothetical protein